MSALDGFFEQIKLVTSPKMTFSQQTHEDYSRQKLHLSDPKWNHRRHYQIATAKKWIRSQHKPRQYFNSEATLWLTLVTSL